MFTGWCYIDKEMLEKRRNMCLIMLLWFCSHCGRKDPDASEVVIIGCSVQLPDRHHLHTQTIMDGTIRNSDRRPPRPLSAKPSRGPQTSAGHAVARRVANPLFGDDEDDLIGEELFQSDDDDDNGENDFEAEALAAQHRLMEQDLRTTRSGW